MVKDDIGTDPDKEYKIMSLYSGQVIDRFPDGGVGTPMCQFTYYGGNNQEWRFIPLVGADKGYYEIKSSLNGLDIKDVGIDVPTGHSVVSGQWEDSGDDNLKWALVPNDNGTWKIKNKATGYIIAIQFGSLSQRAAIITTLDKGEGATENEKWYINPVGIKHP
jgi:hypothetical protein